MANEISDGIVGITVALAEAIMLCFGKKADARQAVEQDIAANEFSWDEPKPKRSWWQSGK